jgi:hypothetical protein
VTNTCAFHVTRVRPFNMQKNSSCFDICRSFPSSRENGLELIIQYKVSYVKVSFCCNSEPIRDGPY